MRHNQDPDEREPKRKSYLRCSDRMCGALDCPTCYPLTYQEPDESLERERYQESNCSPPHLNKEI